MPTPEKGEHWGILGGTFDPIHRGHLTLVRNIQLKKPLDGTLLIPAHKHPLKSEQAVASYDNRLAMLKLAVCELERVRIDEIEKELNLSGYTLDTVRAIKKRYPGVTFYFLVGADNITQMGSWHKPEEILDELSIIAGTRPAFSPEQASGPLAARIEYIETTPVDISSSRIRSLISEGAQRNELIRWLDPSVYDYIVTRGLYR
ncbi:MAG: nicotinate (nicotinamide) nucleotide adenylyltransferase [Candidatus Zixiibacteriota bacterium]|nr:MAG: nicotinate (nicotinamide) nucleotide adenylyltransferase [candidate division Zixibacteria bacterium]